MCGMLQYCTADGAEDLRVPQIAGFKCAAQILRDGCKGAEPWLPCKLERDKHLVILGKCRYVVLERVCHPAVLEPHIAHTLEGVPG